MSLTGAVAGRQARHVQNASLTLTEAAEKFICASDVSAFTLISPLPNLREELFTNMNQCPPAAFGS